MYTLCLSSYTCVSVEGGGKDDFDMKGGREESIEVGCGGGRYITRKSLFPLLRHNQGSNDYLFICLVYLSVCLFFHLFVFPL